MMDFSAAFQIDLEFIYCIYLEQRTFRLNNKFYLLHAKSIPVSFHQFTANA